MQSQIETSSRPSLSVVEEIPEAIRKLLNSEQLKVLPQLFLVAEEMRSKASSPLLSGFHVGEAGLTSRGEIARGANSERGAGPGRGTDDAIHGEDALIADALQRYGADTKLSMVVIVTDAPQPSACCGRCRSALETYCEPDAVIIARGTAGGVKLWKLSELLPDKFTEARETGLNPTEKALLSAAEAAAQKSFQPFTEKVTGRTGAAVCSTSCRIFSGSKVDAVAYYGQSAVGSAIGNAVTAGERPAVFAFVSQTGMPSGEERQLLYEFSSFSGYQGDLPVILKSTKTGKIFRTTAGGLLPDAFGPGDLGITV